MTASRETKAHPAETAAPTCAAGGTRARFWFAVAAIVAIGGLLRLLVLVEYIRQSPFATSLRVDAASYWEWAGRIAAGEIQQPTPFFSAPAYPFFLGLIRALGGGLLAVYTIQLVMDLATAVLLAHVGRRRFGAAVGLVGCAVFLLMFDPASSFVRVLASTMQLVLVALAWWQMVRLQERGTTLRCVALGAVLGLFALTYPPAVLLVLAVGIWLLAWSDRWRARIRRAVVVGLSSAVIVAPATIHNWRATGEFIPISAQAGITLYHGNSADATGVYEPAEGVISQKAGLGFYTRKVFEKEKGRPGSWSEIDAFYIRKSIDAWLDDPVHTVVLFARKFYWFLTGVNYGDVYLSTLEVEDGYLGRLRLTPLHTAWLLPTALVGLAWLVRRSRRHFPEVVLFALPLIVVMIFWYSPRYRMPVVPVVAVAAAVALCGAVGRRTALGWRLAVAGALLTTVGLVAANRWTGFDNPRSYRSMYEFGCGRAWADQGDYQQAIECMRRALQARPNFVAAWVDLADAYHATGRPELAKACLTRVVENWPDSAEAHDALGIQLAEQGQYAEAAAEFRKAIELDPIPAEAYANLGNALARQGLFEQAIEQYENALSINPDSADTWYNLACALAEFGHVERSQQAFQKTIAIRPSYGPAYQRLANLLSQSKRFAEAAAVLRRGIDEVEETTEHTLIVNDLAWLLATCPDPRVRNGAAAIRLANDAINAGGKEDGNLLDTLAAAYAEAGEFDRAVRTASRAKAVAAAKGEQALVEQIESRLTLYQSKQAYHEGN